MENKRLLSLDAFRGLTMLLLTLEGTNLYNVLLDNHFTGLAGLFVLNFHHHPWHGFHFWDLIQPFFMFIVGVAMPFSIKSRKEKGQATGKITWHFVKRCAILLMFGLILHCSYQRKVVFELWNVLSQLSVTILIAYFLMRYSIRFQVIASIVLILATDLTYRFFSSPGFTEPYVMGHNFGSFMDTILMGKINSDGWVAINFIPSAAHTIWGVVVGQLFMKNTTALNKIKVLVLTGIAFLIVGYSLDISGITPIIKRTCTSSFMFVSGGWALLAISLFYYVIDVKGFNKKLLLLNIFGMNSIFIYLFFNFLGWPWLNGFVEIFTRSFFSPLGINEMGLQLVTSLCIFAAEAYMLFWLYKRKIFFKI